MSTSKRVVPFFNYPHVYKQYENEINKAINNVCNRGAFILQKDLEEFEENLANYTGAKYAIGVANGTDALIIANRAAGISEGDEVIFSSHTYIATAASIYFAGGIPVPVECQEDHMISPESVRKAITSKTKAIMPTQLNGRTCDMDSLNKIAEENGLHIIEDAAQGLGSKFNGKQAGTFGLAGTISFYPAKNLGSFGDGGAILTSDLAMYEKMMQLRDHGRNKDGLVVTWGLNSRLDNLQAAILNLKLAYYKNEIERRREIASIYQTNLGSITEIKLPPSPNSDTIHFDVFQNYEIEAERRDELKKYLFERGIGTIIQWAGKTVHQFKDLKFNVSLPFTENMIAKSLMLPMNTSLTDEDVLYVCEIVNSFYNN
ncbi:MAG: DegT/DnrJ/EryC1/StrS family aminotransferase [Bacteroidetes bacterium]|nr:DegT/DnrJ/EryC1/StrS family aminotransferase [Bacteroidota bacterium]MBU1114859.1 DegT/DnrJ/EryC1/StrS family aminotransferase [Bacteroidota bacterium]MBU1797593.1 DegT/DnrJ/EryC1/StrS family aminotransferase [Bacteroidota bacterium]